MKRNSITSYLTVKNAPAAIEFYQQAFGAQELDCRLIGPGGAIVHAEIQIGNSTLMLAEESKEFGNVSPEMLGDSPVRLNLEVDNVDEVVKKAIELGATAVFPVADQFYGYRAGRIQDPFGHVWIVSTFLREVPLDEMQRSMNEMFSSPGG